MGEIAACYADNVIVTDDSPRGEDPALIRQAIKQGCPHAIEIGDRYEAIKTAVKGLRKEDVLLIAGRGCEKKQIRVFPSGRIVCYNDVVSITSRNLTHEQSFANITLAPSSKNKP
jgi:hypothetical protein